MTSLQDLPPDQHATLTLLLSRGKSYDDVASLLGIEPRAVHDRAHAALAVLAPSLARGLDAQTRERIGEYLLGRQDEATAADTKAQLALSASQREWARAVALSLVELAADPLPQIPDEQPAASRRGGAVVLALLAVLLIAVVAVVLGTSGSGKAGAPKGAASPSASVENGSSAGEGTNAHHAAGHKAQKRHARSKHGAGNGTTGSGSASEGGEGASTSGKASERQIESQMNLTAAEEGGSATGVLLVVSENSQKGLLLDAERLPPTEGFVYYLWLIDSKGQAKPYAIEAPSVPASGKAKERMIAVSLLPKTASSYDEVELTKQTEAQPTTPSSEVVLKGAFSLH